MKNDRTIRIRMATLAVAVALLTSIGITSSASAKYASIVVDAESGEIRHSVNAETRNFPASLTKLMTLYLLFDAIDHGKLRIDDRFSVSRRAANQPASRLGLKPGQSIKVETAILSLVIKSANDVATVVAENLSGSERKFALVMTNQARKLGMHRTTFRNASGLPHRGQLSTARDMSILARAIQDQFPHYYHYFSRKAFAYGGRTYRTHNKILKTLDGADGLKTGYIRASGYNVITSAEREGQRLIGVVFGGNSARARDRHMKDLMNRAFDAQKREALVASGITPGRKPAPALLAKPAPPRTIVTTASNVWGIQVGAFYSRQPAYTAAKKALQRLGRLTEGGQISLMPLQKSKRRVLYRSRILGISKASAYRACRELSKHKTPCMELRLPAGVAFNSAGSAS